MIAGTLGLLEPVEEPLEPYSSGGFTTLDVQETLTYLDDKRVQHGTVCNTVEGESEEVHVEGTSITVERVTTRERAWTDWVADVTDAGWVVAERTRSGDPPFPFDVFYSRTGSPVERAHIDIPQFVRNQRDAERDWSVWMTGRKDETGEDDVDNTSISYGANAIKKDAINSEIGIGFQTPWNGDVVSGVLYNSGYIAIHNPSSWGPMQFARFVSDEIVPVAYVPETDDEGEQSTFDEGGASA